MTITLGDISVRYVNLMLSTAQTFGMDAKLLQIRFNLPDTLLSQPNARVSIPKYMRLGQHIISESGRADLGLLCGSTCTLATLGLTGFLSASAATLEQALHCMIEYESLNSKNARGHSSFHLESEKVIAQFYSISPYNEFNCFVVDMALSSQMHLINQLGGKEIPLQCIYVEYPEPDNTEDYSAIFRCPIYFGQARNALIYRAKDLQSPSLLHDKVTFEELKLIADHQKQQRHRTLSLQERVMNKISPLLPGANVSIDEVAVRLDLPPWTLRRKLKQEGILFRDLVDDTRKALALIYIRDLHYSLGEIAYLLGFAHPAAFQRAFSRWTGIAPGKFRKSLDNNV